MTTTRFFCTYFDHNYLSRALALHASLRQHCPRFVLFALCLDAEALDRVRQCGHEDLVGIPIQDLEAAYPKLLEVRPQRSRIEYYFTAGPSFLLFLLDKHPEIGLLSYLDSDLMFFSSPDPLFQELEGMSVGIVEHRFPPGLAARLRFGRYNVGLVSFRRDSHGMAALSWWADRCLEWCYDRVEDGKYADQKYLDDWVVRFPGVRVIQNKGVNVAPWNVIESRIAFHEGRVFVDQAELIFFHFHGFKRVGRFLYDTNIKFHRFVDLLRWLTECILHPGRSRYSILRKHVFTPYIHAVGRHEVETTSGVAKSRSIRRPKEFWWSGSRIRDLSLGLISFSYLRKK